MQKSKVPVENYSNKIFQTLLSLEAGARKRLIKYLQSPYFVQSKPLLTLCTAFSNEIDKGSSGFDRQKIWQILFPGTTYDDVNFRKYCSDLLQYTQDFMAHEVLATDPIRQSIATLEYIAEHKIEPISKSAFQNARKSLEAQDYRPLSHFLSAYTIERQFYSMMNFGVKVDTRSNIEDISQNLDVFYWIEKLKLFSSALSQQKTGNQQYQIRFLKEIIKELQVYPIEEIPELAIYYYSFLTIYEAENLEHYYNLKRMLERYGKFLPQKDAIELIDSALHYCTGKINKGNPQFYQEYFDLFEDALEKKVLIVNGELATWRFNNMVAAALGLGKLSLAEKFVESNKDLLPEGSRENTYTFNLARVYRYQKKYDEVLKLLQNVDYEDIGYNLISKATLLITYFELNELETLDSFTSSFRTFLSRHKNIPKPRRQGYLNLIKYTRRLIRLNPHDKAAIAKLREEITREKASTINHEWLLEKLN